jgi:hypothetical protein
MPRTTKAKQCYHCQGLGHVQAECPTLRLSGAGAGNRCYNCDSIGHLAVRALSRRDDVTHTDFFLSATAPTPPFPASAVAPLLAAAASLPNGAASSADLAPRRATSAAARTTLLATARRRR